MDFNASKTARRPRKPGNGDLLRLSSEKETLFMVGPIFYDKISSQHSREVSWPTFLFNQFN